MSDNIYNILNNFNKVAQEPAKPATQKQPKATTKLQESMEQVLSRKLVAEKKNDGNLANNAKPYDKVTRGDVIAGRLGKDEMGGKKKDAKVKEGKLGSSLKNLKPLDKAVINTGAAVIATDQAKKLAQMAKSSMTPDPAPAQQADVRAVDNAIDAAEVKETDYSAKKARAGKDIGKPGKNFEKIAKGAAERYGSKERGEKVAGAVLAKLRAKESVEESEMDESALQAYLGKKKYGEQGMKALQKAGREGASKEKMASIRAHHDKMDEVAPPGEKAERMVKHIKKGYAKDGKITPKEKSIAYATAWKAHNKGKVEEAVRAMFEAGFTKEQIVEGWDEMMKSVKDRAQSGMKTGEKRQGAKGEIEKTSTGVKHTRRYDPKTGETETGADGEQVKRGRGRPKKSAFESRSMATNMIVETFTKLFDDAQGSAAPIQPKDAQKWMQSSDPKMFDKLTGTKPTTPTGTVKQGTWQADAPKAGEKPVPVPQNPEVAKEEEDMEEGNYFSGQLAKARAAGKKQADLDGDGDMEQVRENEEELNESKCMECGMYESKCKCDDKVSESLNLFRKLAGLQECGMSPISGAVQDMEQQQGKMNINTSMDSDGHKSVTITADGDSALELMQMLKLAGMGEHEGHEAHNHAEPEGVMVVSTDEEEVDENLIPVPNPSGASSVDQAKKLGASMPAPAGGKDPIATKEAKDERYHANTTPEEHVMPTQVLTKGGDGDVAGQEKKMTKHGYQFGDNPKAMKESMSLKLIKEYEGIKVKK
jgi:hypothetical protein